MDEDECPDVEENIDEHNYWRIPILIKIIMFSKSYI